MSSDDNGGLFRPVNSARIKQAPLFDIDPPWVDLWYGMPEFSMKDVAPGYRITINFLTAQDVAKFAEITGIKVTANSDSGWFPNQPVITPGRFYYDGPKSDSKYPVCIPSKGRHDIQTTGKILDQLGVSYRFFVEDCEYDLYVRELGESRVIRLPFSNLGQGSVPARNFIWDWAADNKFERHWVLDDNIKAFARMHNNRRLNVKGGAFFRAMEDFVDRFENIAMAGPHDKAFSPDRIANAAPFKFNSRVYSCILLDTSLPHRWRGRYNEDTDLCLRALKDGWATVLFKAMLMKKAHTSRGDGDSGMPGGNSDGLYNSERDYRLSFAESLKAQHPDVVDVVWKFGRWHHQVNYSPFKNNQLKLREGVTPRMGTNEYGLRLERRSEVAS